MQTKRQPIVHGGSRCLRSVAPLFRCLAALLTALLATSSAPATWSINLTDDTTGETAAGTVTCLNNFDLLAIVPVIVVGKGSAAVQSAGDFAGVRRPIIFDELEAGTDPAVILDILEGISGHQSRQYGIADTLGRKITFSGSQNGAWAGGVTGNDGSIHYAIQGNVLAGACVVAAIEAAVVDTPGDIPAKLMAGMEAARDAGGDGRCSCGGGDPPGCGCPIEGKSGHIGGMVVARIGDTDDNACNANGCVDGDYLMRLNVAFQPSGNPDPVDQLRAQFDAWRAGLEDRPDANASTVAFDPELIPANGVATTTMTITLRDWRHKPVGVPIPSLTVEHAPGSAGRSTIGAVTDIGGGVFEVTLTAGTAAGVDRFRVVADDDMRPVTLTPDATFEYFTPGDIDGNGVVNFVDLLAVLGAWGPCADPPAACPADVNGSGAVEFGDIVVLLGNWG